ncbi:MAG: ATP-grasp domain-containing protein [Acidimicrobiia bacterium]
MTRVLLLLPTSTYRASDFVRAATRLGVEVVVGSEEPQAMAGDMGDRAVVVPLSDIVAAVDAIVALHGRSPIAAVVAVDDQGVEVAAAAGERLGLPHNDPAAVSATRDKSVMRDALARAGIPQPRFRVVERLSRIADAAEDIGFPCVLKPVGLSASRGVIRADDVVAATVAAERIRAIVDGPLLVEEYVPGVEVAVEGLVLDPERVEILAIFDKPDPLEGPYFEETIYVTPSRLSPETLAAVSDLTARAARAIGLTGGPIHAEIRIAGDRRWVVEIAARSIGGLCARTLRFGAGIALEELILRHALGLPLDDLERERAASGVMMLPISRAGVLEVVRGQDDARAVAGITGLEITVPRGRRVVPLPEGDRYLGFLFARAERPEQVETALRAGYAALDVELSS